MNHRHPLSSIPARYEAQEDHACALRDALALSEESRDAWIIEIAHEKLQARLALNDPADFIAALESFPPGMFASVYAVFLSDAEAFRALVLARRLALLIDSAIDAASTYVEKAEGANLTPEHRERIRNEAYLEA